MSEPTRGGICWILLVSEWEDEIQTCGHNLMVGECGHQHLPGRPQLLSRMRCMNQTRLIVRYSRWHTYCEGPYSSHMNLHIGSFNCCGLGQRRYAFICPTHRTCRCSKSTSCHLRFPFRIREIDLAITHLPWAVVTAIYPFRPKIHQRKAVLDVDKSYSSTSQGYG